MKDGKKIKRQSFKDAEVSVSGFAKFCISKFWRKLS